MTPVEEENSYYNAIVHVHSDHSYQSMRFSTRKWKGNYAGLPIQCRSTPQRYPVTQPLAKHSIICIRIFVRSHLSRTQYFSRLRQFRLLLCVATMSSLVQLRIGDGY